MPTFFGHVTHEGDIKAWPEVIESGRCALEGYVLPSGARCALTGSEGSDATSRLIEAEGVGSLATLNGEFALAFMDADSSLVLARDVFGSRPLYYARTSTGIAFASTIADLLRHTDIPREPNTDVLRRYLLGDTQRGSETFFSGIARVLPGESVKFAREGLVRTPLLDAHQDVFAAPSNPRRADHSCIEEFRTRLTDAVTRRATGEGAALVNELDPVASQALEHAVRSTDSPLEVLRCVPSAGGPSSDAREHQGVVTGTPQSLKKDLPLVLRTYEEPPVSLESYFAWLHLRACIQGEQQLALDTYGASALHRASDTGSSLLTRVVGAVRGSARYRCESLLGPSLRSGERERAIGFEPSPEYEGPLAPLATSGSHEAEQRAKAAHALGGHVMVRSPFTDLDLLRFYASLEETAFGGAGTRSLIEAAYDQAHEKAPSLSMQERETAWFKRIKGTYFSLFSSQTFGTRGWFDQAEVLKAFDAHINGRSSVSAAQLWRFACAELWARVFFDADDLEALDAHEDSDVLADDNGQSLPPDPHTPLTANAGKQLDLELNDGTLARRYPIQTAKFSKDSRMDEEIAGYVKQFFKDLDERGTNEDRHATENRRWNFTVSEKIIAIMQGRSWFVWEIKPSFAAKQLSRFVTRTPAGIGLGDPVTMQLAINEAGLARITYAAALGALGKLRGKRGVFYEHAGADVRAIDGPTEYSVYPSNVSAKLPPKDPDLVAAHLVDVIREVVPARFVETFDGVVVMDANDIGRNVLGLAASREREHYEAQFADNPLGQGSQQTPMAVVFERPVHEC
ncbi:hypothetical protein [Dermabacter hominis]|uniref:hypothetical protein n=1 Tax=Dermabacter hominis TaxID=36740 RepID=UPI0015DF3FFE|nr:hypothetical protein CYJ49_000550 [Dermabacter hominis]